LTAPEIGVNNTRPDWRPHHVQQRATPGRGTRTIAMRRSHSLKIVAGSLLFAIAMFVGKGVAGPPVPDHPILGAWTFTIPDSHCSETYEFRADGTLLSISGEARSERVYEITASPNPEGFYTLVDKVIRENGKLDCFGEPTEPGVSAIIFIRFSNSGHSFVACEVESPDNCIGPLQRIRRNEV
jgi:hypothetical protein